MKYKKKRIESWINNSKFATFYRRRNDEIVEITKPIEVAERSKNWIIVPASRAVTIMQQIGIA
ncbi:MAG: hypothetical protein NT027_08730 [Proteobacteria bacterium]|nr:hypothetical protein [Pseudomonadota bacterium]